jgi:flagellin
MVGIDGSGGLKIVHQLTNTDKLLKKYLEELSTGEKINDASDDSANLGVSERMRSQVSGYLKELSNIQDNISRSQTFEGTAAGVQEAVGRIGELAVQASNGTNTADDRKAIQQEIDALNQSITSLAQTKYNDQPIAANLAPEAVGTAGIDVVANAARAIAAAEQANKNVASLRTEAGAEVKAWESQINSLAVAAENTMAAESQIRDADVAESMLNLVQEQMKARGGIAMLAQFNVSQSSILKLLE